MKETYIASCICIYTWCLTVETNQSSLFMDSISSTYIILPFATVFIIRMHFTYLKGFLELMCNSGTKIELPRYVHQTTPLLVIRGIRDLMSYNDMLWVVMNMLCFVSFLLMVCWNLHMPGVEIYIFSVNLVLMVCWNLCIPYNKNWNLHIAWFWGGFGVNLNTKCGVSLYNSN